MNGTPTLFAATAALLIMSSVASAKTEYLPNVPKDGDFRMERLFTSTTGSARATSPNDLVGPSE